MTLFYWWRFFILMHFSTSSPLPQIHPQIKLFSPPTSGDPTRRDLLPGDETADRQQEQNQWGARMGTHVAGDGPLRLLAKPYQGVWDCCLSFICILGVSFFVRLSLFVIVIIFGRVRGFGFAGRLHVGVCVLERQKEDAEEGVYVCMWLPSFVYT